jgi:hypothetical protein
VSNDSIRHAPHSITCTGQIQESECGGVNVLGSWQHRPAYNPKRLRKYSLVMSARDFTPPVLLSTY